MVCRYRSFFALLDWSVVPARDVHRSWPGPCPHPETASLKALLVKLCESKASITDLRPFLVEHPFLVLELGFLPILDPAHLYGFDIERTVPGDRWLRHKQQSLDQNMLHNLLVATVHALQEEIPGLVLQW